MKNQINISNLTPEQIEDLRQQLKALDEQHKSIINRVKSWEDAYTIAIREIGYFINSQCHILETDEPVYYSQNKNVVPSKRHAKSILATSQLMVIAEALNEGWKPNYEDSQNKYCVNYDEGDLIVDYCIVTCTNPIVFKSEETAKYAITQFPELWYDYFMIDKPE